jgi:hypothetical protein
MTDNNEPTRQVYNSTDHIRIQDRLCALDFLNYNFIDNIYSTIDIVYKGVPVKVKHPDVKIHRGLLVKISKLFAKKYYQLYGVKPDIKEGTRTNIYELAFYHGYGDEIIRDVIYNKENHYKDIQYDYDVSHFIQE